MIIDNRGETNAVGAEFFCISFHSISLPGKGDGLAVFYSSLKPQ